MDKLTTRWSPLRTWRMRHLVLAVLVLANVPAKAGDTQPELSVVIGAVEIGRGEPPAWQAAHVGDLLGAGDSVRTGRGGRAEVNLGTGVARLFENSLLRLPSEGMRPEGAAAVGLDHGASLFDVHPRRPGDPFEVRTPEVVASVKGTRFGVVLEDTSAMVSVYTGLVGVRKPEAEGPSEVFVREGFSAVGGEGRPFDLSLHSGGDMWGGWAKGLAAPVVPGQPAHAASSNGSHEVDAARAAALRAAAPEVLSEIVANHPEIAKAGAGNPPAVPKVPAEIDVDTPAQGVKPSTLPVVDPVAQAENSESQRALQEKVAEAILNGGLPAATGAPASTGAALAGTTVPAAQYSVKVVSSGGSATILIVNAAGQQIATVAQSTLNQVVQTGNSKLLSPQLLSVLASTGTNPLTFATQMVKTLHD
jgi:FecR protein